MENKKFVVPTDEEQSAFNEGLQELCENHSMHIEIVPQFKPNMDSKAYEVTGMLLLRKVVDEVVGEKVEDGAVKSPDEVNPNAETTTEN